MLLDPLQVREELALAYEDAVWCRGGEVQWDYESLLQVSEAALWLCGKELRVRDEAAAGPTWRALRGLKDGGEIAIAPAKAGLFFYGAPGNGKSTLMEAMFSMMVQYRDERRDLVEYYNPATAKLDSESGEMKNASISIVKATARELAKGFADSGGERDTAKVDVLFIDDLGVEPAEVLCYGNVLNPLADILTRRYELQLHTVVSTNMGPDGVAERYGDRVFDRFCEMMHSVRFQRGETYRMKG